MPQPVLVPIQFDQGLHTKFPSSVSPPGALQEARNYEYLPNGGFAVRRPWTQWGTSGAPVASKRAARGLNADYLLSGVRQLVWAMDDATDSMDLYRAAYSAGGALTSIEDVAVSTRTQPVKFAAAEDRLYYSHPGFPDGNIRYWDGAATAAVSAFDNIAGASLTYHLNRMWTGGGATEPSRLYFSSIGDATTWNLTEGFLDVGKDDGGAIRETCIFDRTLLIGKENGLWLLGGSTLDTFQLYPLNRFLPVAAGRSMLPTERGVFIVNEQGVWRWDGASFDEITTPLDFTLSGAYATLAYADGKLWVQDVGASFTWVTDGRRWWQEDSKTEDVGEVYGWGRYLYGGMKAGAGTPALYRQEPGTARGGTETGGVDFLGETSMVWHGPPDHGKVTFRKLWVRYRQLGGTGTTDAHITVTSDQGQTADVVLPATGVSAGVQGAGLRQTVGEVNLIGNAFELRVYQNLAASATCHIQVEEMEAEVLMDSEEPAVNENTAPELLLPTRRMGTFEHPEVKRLAALMKRSLDEIERWGNAPHRTYGSRMISPFYVVEKNTVDDVNMVAKGSGSYGNATFDAVDLSIDRRSLAICWATGEIVNDSNQAYTVYPFIVVSSSGGVDDGNAIRQYMNNDSEYRHFTQMRRVYLDPPASPTTYTFAWAFLQAFSGGSGINKVGKVGKCRMIVGIFDAPDMDTDDDADVLWTPSAVNRTAYRSQESGTDFS